MAVGDGDGFCGSPFWDEQVTWNTTDPDFTPCFQKTVLMWIPLAFLVLLSPYKFYSLWHLQDRVIKWNMLSSGKIVLASFIGVLMAILCVASVVERTQGHDTPPVNFVSPLLLVLAMFLDAFFVYLERRKGIRTSGLLLLFWLLTVLLGVIIIRSKILTAVLQGRIEKKLDFAVFILYFMMSVASLVLSAIVDRKPEFDVVQQEVNPCPEGNSSFLSRITFWWFTGLVVKGYKKALVRADLWSLNKEDTSAEVQKVFDKHWQAQLRKHPKSHQKALANGVQTNAVFKDGDVAVEVKVVDGVRKKPTLLKTLVKSFVANFFVAFGFKLFHDILVFIGPQLLKLLIQFTSNKEEFMWRGYMYAVLLFVVALIQSIVLHQYFHGCLVLGMRLRSVIISAVYRKMLVLSNSAKKTSTVGEIVNLMSVDAQRFMDLMTYFHTIWSGPFQICVSLFFLWQILGPSVLAGIGVMVLLIPVNAWIAHKTRQLQTKQMVYKDGRIKLMNEVLSGIKVLKLYAWELSFQQKILNIRNEELKVLKQASYLNAASSFFWTCAPFMVSLTTFAVYTLSDPNNVLDAEKAFVSLSLFNIMRFPLSMLPNVITNIVQASVSLKRLQKFLDNDELDSEAVQKNVHMKQAIRVEHGAFRWDKDGPNILTDIDLEVEEGSLVAVVGSVGSGKSSLLSALLGEMEKLSGFVNIRGSVAYVAQQAWIQNATMRNNILFNSDFNQHRYDKAVYACALQQDLQMLPAGDQTEIGEKGINLSGGQKQRVSLARATYQDADVYLLDDPLSAVDSHVGKHIFDNVIGPNGTLRKKTRVLVTHGISFLPKVDKIVVLKDGRISEVGSFSQLMDHNGAFAEFLKNYLTEELVNPDSSVDPSDLEGLSLREDVISHLGSIIDSNEGARLQRQLSALTERIRSNSEVRGSLQSLSSIGSRKPDAPVAVPEDVKPAKKPQESDKLIQAEAMETGRVKFAVFLAYLKAVGAVLSASIVVLYVLYDAASIGSNIWLSDWSNDARRSSNITSDTEHRNMRLGVYGALGVVQGVLVTLAAWVTALAGVKASRSLFASLLSALMHWPMSQYNRTPMGQIVNRCSQDIAEVDLVVAFSIRSMINCVLMAAGTFSIIVFTTPLAVCALPFLAAGYFCIQASLQKTWSGGDESRICLCIFVGTFIRTLGARNASRSLHAAFLANILQCPMHFFDVTPLGRIVNRFSKDVDAIDVVVPLNAHMFLMCFLHVLSTIIVISMGTPLFLSVIVPLMVLYYFVQCQHFCMFIWMGSFLRSRGACLASKILHANLLRSLMHLPMVFFDTTPAGRIVNRCGKDVDVIDVSIPSNFDSFLGCSLKVLGTVVVISVTTPLILTAVVPLAVLYFAIQRFYVASSRQLKRLESTSRSPIYSHFGETITGAVTIRAFGHQGRFIQLSESKVDENQVCYYPSIVSNRWLAIRLEFVGNCIIFFASLFAVLGRDNLSPGIVGLSVSYAMNVTQTLNWMVRMTCELETNIVAVERVKEYTEIPTEAPWEVPDRKPDSRWPQAGRVEFSNYQVRYREGLDLVLRGISCSIKAGEKIGIVGRTGAGKSSLTLALFRIIESAGGSIIIDSINIADIGLHDLRSKLTIIPQDPVLFSGSLRMNLDPFGDQSDEELWQALEHAHLKNFVQSLSQGLDYECTEGGENLSVGQRQLVCLARALLRKTRILILDEATAAVDLETDDLIQGTIRVEFAESTVLTIAHRLNTIMDYTRIMVLDAGRIAEFDSPQALLQNPTSIFYGMAKDAGLV